MPKILLFANTDWYLYNFRLALAKELRAQGNAVILLSPPGDFQDRLEAEGFQWHSFPLSRQGINPLDEFWTLWRLIRIYNKIQPDIVHHFTIKPVIYGSLAAQILHVGGIINSITGLGHLFIDQRMSTRLLRSLVGWLYRTSLRDTQVIFENSEDRDIFIRNKFIMSEQSHLIPGTGVNINKFQPSPKNNTVPLVLFSSRLLVTKGLLEFVEAAKLLGQRGLKARFVIAGTPDSGNPASIPNGQIEAWKESGVVEIWGWQDDMPATLAQTDVFCLPSYREGVPNALLEACACGLPIVTTDVPGCREVVAHDVNGLLVTPRDHRALADALEKLLVDPMLRSKMGAAGRQVALAKFSLQKNISQNLTIYQKLLKTSG